MHKIKVSIVHFLCLLLKRCTFLFTTDTMEGIKHSSINSDLSSYLQNLDGDTVEYSCFHKKISYKSCYLPLLESSADVSMTIHSLINPLLLLYSSGYTCNDYFGQFRDTESSLTRSPFLLLQRGPLQASQISVLMLTAALTQQDKDMTTKGH